MAKENNSKDDESKRINFILWGIGNRLSSLGVIASSEWDVGDKLDPEHPEKQFLEVNLDPSIYITYDGKKTFYIAPFHNYFLFGEKVSGPSLEASSKKLTKILSAQLGEPKRLLSQIKQDYVIFGLAAEKDIEIKGDTLSVKGSLKEGVPQGVRVETYDEEGDTGINLILVNALGEEEYLGGNPSKNQFLAASKLLGILASAR
jgi:hypothetical protein